MQQHATVPRVIGHSVKAYSIAGDLKILVGKMRYTPNIYADSPQAQPGVEAKSFIQAKLGDWPGQVHVLGAYGDIADC